MNAAHGLLLLALASSPAGPEPEDCGIPLMENTAPFVGKDACLRAVEWADLNRDGIVGDAVMVLERRKPGTSEPDPAAPRSVLILTAQADDSLKIVKRNDKLVACASCEQDCGDTFTGLEAGPGTFTLTFDTGCTASKAELQYTFAFSRRDRTWQLVRVRVLETSADPRRASTALYTPPKDFGKIDFADFDRTDWPLGHPSPPR